MRCFFFLVSRSAAGLCHKSVHHSKRLHHWQTELGLQPVRPQQRRLHHQRGDDDSCLRLICGWTTASCNSFFSPWFCSPGDDGHHGLHLRHDGEVHLPQHEGQRSQGTRRQLFPGESPPSARSPTWNEMSMNWGKKSDFRQMVEADWKKPVGGKYSKIISVLVSASALPFVSFHPFICRHSSCNTRVTSPVQSLLFSFS